MCGAMIVFNFTFKFLMRLLPFKFCINSLRKKILSLQPSRTSNIIG